MMRAINKNFNSMRIDWKINQLEIYIYYSDDSEQNVSFPRVYSIE